MFSSDGTAWNVGKRYLDWDYFDAPRLSDADRALALEAFAVEFENVPPELDPMEGWGETMAYLCRRIAARWRGEPEGEWVPRWKRVARQAGVTAPQGDPANGPVGAHRDGCDGVDGSPSQPSHLLRSQVSTDPRASQPLGRV